jgi:hypothetical protein
LQEVEVEDLRRAYESLALEGRRLQSTVAQMEREAASREAALAAKADEAASLAEASRAAQAQIAQYVMDLQVGWVGRDVCMHGQDPGQAPDMNRLTG